MPPKKTKNSRKQQQKGEVQVQKSPAEFFAENQAIAGFDNRGKSLYTSIRELVENSLDACESIGVLPSISVEIVEYTQAEFNKLAGLGESPRKRQTDKELFQKRKSSGGGSNSRKSKPKSGEEKDGSEASKESPHSSTKKNAATSSAASNNSKRASASQQDAYFRITVKDNGCGMKHDAIPDLFGRVLSGSKYGVRQTRGKFGLGAKMALIWSKKSSGQPVRITTAHRPDGVDGDPPSHFSRCVLDIDIYKNEPKILQHEWIPNEDPANPVIGTTVEVLIAGNWTTYKSRIVQYLQQLAVITPYAVLELTYDNASDTTGKRHLHMAFARRSEQMPPPAQTVKHHPSSVNNLVIQQLIQQIKMTDHKKSSKNMTLVKFLSTQLSAVSPALAKRLIAELQTHTSSSSADDDEDYGTGITETMHPTSLSDKQITRLVQLLRQVQLFKAPDGSCLSPAGEYNLNLGIRKVLEPDLIATARDKPGAYEGHPFLVEAAVCLGGGSGTAGGGKQQTKDILKEEGITVVRFANRIPLLFEGGADVSTRVALSKIKWSNYKIDAKKDKVGVFISIVSTKIPFKGTSKEYIGDDATAIQLSVKRALQSCCQQLRVHLLKRNALKDAKERKSRLVKYVPDVSRSIFGLLDGMRKRRREEEEEQQQQQHSAPPTSPAKRLRLEESQATDMIRRMNRGDVTEASIQKLLEETIDEQQKSGGSATHLDEGQKNKAGVAGGSSGRGVIMPTLMAAAGAKPVPLFIVPLYNLDDSQHDVCTSLFRFRPIQPVPQV